MSGLWISRAILVMGYISLVAGITGQFGTWWGMIVAGSLAVVGAMTLIEVPERKEEIRR